MSLCQQKESLGVIFCDSLIRLPMGSALALCPARVDVEGGKKKKLHVQGDKHLPSPRPFSLEVLEGPRLICVP